MGDRQHRCPFYLLKITPQDLDLINFTKQKDNNLIAFYEKQLNTVTLEYQTLKGIFEKIVDIIRPYLNCQRNYTFDEVVENSLLNEKTKKSTLSLIRQYKDYCSKKLEQDMKSKKGETEPDKLMSLYDPKNAFEFVSNHEKKYQRGTIKKNLNTLLRYIRLATKNPYLSYEFPIGKGEHSKLKHIITIDELKKFIKYLNSKKYYVIIVICMLMYKFGLRIGPLAKIKVKDFLPNNIIIFKEKNSQFITRKLLTFTAEILRRLINECSLKEDDYIFYYFKFDNDEDKRCQFFAQKIRNILHESNCFSLSTTESLSSHIFRATYAVNSYQNNKVEKIQSNLGHQMAYTTLNSYIQPERRNLNLNEEERNNIKGIKALKNRIFERNLINDKSNEDTGKYCEEQSIDFDEEGEDYIDDDLEQNDNIFYFTGHFYDDVDIIEYINSRKNSENILENNPKNISIFDNNFIQLEKSIAKEKKINFKGHEEIRFNNIKKKNHSSSFDEFNIFGIKNFEDSVNIEESATNLIKIERIKNKNELYQLNKNENIILEETLNLNRKGIYYNLKGVVRNGKPTIVASDNIPKNVLITMIGGLVYFKKNNNTIKQFKYNKKEKSNTLLYFKTAKSIYDRFIKLSKNSLVNFFFQDTRKTKENLDIIKVVDSQYLIKLLVITNKYIKKGESLSLNKKLLVNID